MGIIRGTHTSPGIYTQITDIINTKKQPTTRIGAIGYNTTKNHNKNNNGGGDKPKPSVKNYLTFTALEDNSLIGLKQLGTNQSLWYSYSSDFATSHDFDTSTNISLNSGDKVYVRGILSADSNPFKYTRFKMSGKIAASGNCNALWNYEDLSAPLKQYCGYYMFEYCTSLTTAPELPATELADYCYQYMFYGCTSLTTAPDLHATTLSSSCYYQMFYDCTSLTTAPELPATELAHSCYRGMFDGCTSLTTAPDLPAVELPPYCYHSMFQDCSSLITAPELPATTLVDYCYEYMFDGCTSLTVAPELPATTLTKWCYYMMFYNCTSLNYIKCLVTDISASLCTGDWVKNVSATGTFIKHPDATWSTGDDGTPEGWTVEDAVL